jgi:hypothetical protein
MSASGRKADSGQPRLTNLDTRPTLLPSVGLTVGTTARSEKNGVFQPLLVEEAVIIRSLVPCSMGKCISEENSIAWPQNSLIAKQGKFVRYQGT